MTTTTTSTTIHVEYLDENDITALYDNNDGEQAPKPVIIELSLETGSLYTTIDHERGNSRPMAQVHNRLLRFGVGLVPTADTANTLIDRIVAPARLILAHTDIEWDGSNHIGQIGAVAENCIQEIEGILENFRAADDPSTYITELKADDWFMDCTPIGISDTTTDEEIAALVRYEQDEALHVQEPVVLLGALDYVTRARDDLRHNQDA